MKEKLIFNVRDQTLSRIDTFSPVKCSRNYLYAKFNFKTEDWSGKIKTAIFHGDGIGPIAVILDGEDMCLVPWQATDRSSFTVSVFAGDLITTDKVTIRLKETGYEKGETPSLPEPDAYGQILEEIKIYIDSQIGGVLDGSY